MKKATRKIYLSLMLVVASLVTMVATTFAWVGIVTNASFEKITINLETDNEESDYGVQLSLTGNRGDFHDSIDALDLQKVILRNMGVPESKLNTEVNISNTFNSIKLSQATTTKIIDASGPSNYLSQFKDLYGQTPYANIGGSKTNYLGYFEFDIWVAIYKIGDIDEGSTNKLSIFLRGGESGLLSSKLSSAYVANEIKLPDSTNPLSTEYLKEVNNFGPGKKIRGNVTINPASAVRLSVQKGMAVDYGDSTNYNNRNYQGLVIYKTGSDIPTYDEKRDVYDFGGILPTDFNFARLLYNSTRPEEQALGVVPDAALPENRGDITYVDDGIVNHIVNKTDGVTTSNMIKLHFCFWFEGWDSDCFEAINDQPVSVNLNFSTKDPNEE